MFLSVNIWWRYCLHPATWWIQSNGDASSASISQIQLCIRMHLSLPLSLSLQLYYFNIYFKLILFLPCDQRSSNATDMWSFKIKYGRCIVQFQRLQGHLSLWYGYNVSLLLHKRDIVMNKLRRSVFRQYLSINHQ